MIADPKWSAQFHQVFSSPVCYSHSYNTCTFFCLPERPLLCDWLGTQASGANGAHLLASRFTSSFNFGKLFLQGTLILHLQMRSKCLVFNMIGIFKWSRCKVLRFSKDIKISTRLVPLFSFIFEWSPSVTFLNGLSLCSFSLPPFTPSTPFLMGLTGHILYCPYTLESKAFFSFSFFVFLLFTVSIAFLESEIYYVDIWI